MRGHNHSSTLYPASLAFLSLLAVGLSLPGPASGQWMRTAWVAYREGEIADLAFSPDGKRMATAGAVATVREVRYMVHTWDSKTEKCLKSFSFDPDNRPSYVEFLPSGEALRVATWYIAGRRRIDGGDVWHYDLRSGARKREWSSSYERVAALWADKNLVVTTFEDRDDRAGRYGLKLINLATGKAMVRRFSERFGVLGFSHDRKLAVLDLGGRKAQVLDLASGKAVGEVPLTEAEPGACVLAPDNKTLAVLVVLERGLPWRELQFWDIRTGKKTATHKRRCGYNRFGDTTPDGRYLTLMHGSVVAAYDLKENLLETKAYSLGGHINCVRFTRDGQVFATGASDGTLCIFEVEKE